MELIGLAHLLFSKVGIFGVALIWGLKLAVSWTLYRWWKIKRTAVAVIKD
ncbi:MAG: hypothetical protein P1U75_02490 [Antarcticimicrobium sp.]|nr:hypothetical protein [Antarcticimicrobium sp.]MDF1715531.1 hypothetical protein [Antarcticimicrobium sp.]